MRSLRFVAPVLCLASLAVACRSGDIVRNGARNAFGRGGERIGDLAGAAIDNAEDLQEQMSIAFSPEQEYYLGRGVAAAAIARYGLDPDEGRQAYVRLIGATLVELAPRVRATYGGYHFAVLNSDEANGISGPGGFILITRGALVRAKNEDEVAGILAHEIAHVSLKHGEGVLRGAGIAQSQLSGTFRLGMAALGGPQRQQARMTTLFKDSVRGLAGHLASTGYGSAAETKADVEGSFVLYDTGYDASAIASYLRSSPERPHVDWAAHPPSRERAEQLGRIERRYGGSFDGGVGLAARTARFARTMGGTKPVAATGEAEPLSSCLDLTLEVFERARRAVEAARVAEEPAPADAK
jgi:beta-barrel assembly-enhancing protease